ncbi:hypothetical protein HPB50_015485 [Hyalomma asiaticum]|uniref:Uncharacterized protein n=1 Tax=Hyalomma asiaticum TaxID=266040 RepID=A0ACB7S2S6_HYAAI|nr:hypothetical protein HPB50_015485 [Hyalomma asiaticum]
MSRDPRSAASPSRGLALDGAERSDGLDRETLRGRQVLTWANSLKLVMLLIVEPIWQGATANKDLPQSAPPPDAELSLSSALTRTMPSPKVPVSAEESYEDCLQAVCTLLHSPTTRCAIDIPHHPTSQDEVTTKREQEGSRASLGVCAGDGGPSTCRRDLSTNDVVVGGKVMGIYYAPGQVIDRVVLTSIDMHVEPKLGGCAERLHGPLSLLSQAEKLDEGWILSFD